MTNLTKLLLNVCQLYVQPKKTRQLPYKAAAMPFYFTGKTWHYLDPPVQDLLTRTKFKIILHPLQLFLQVKQMLEKLTAHLFHMREMFL